MFPPGDLAGVPHLYTSYGLNIFSELSLGLPTANENATPDVALRVAAPGAFDETVAATSPFDADSWYQRYPLADGGELLRWPQLFDFLISADGRSVACAPREDATLESLQTYLLGHALSYSLVRQHHEPLHATAVEVDGNAVALLGQSGQGKSTLAAAFLAAGHRLVTDDLLVLRREGSLLRAYPGPARLKLFPDALCRFLPSLEASGRMNPLTEKLIVDLRPQHTHCEPVPLRAFVLLDGGEGAKLSITRVPGGAAFREVLAASFNKKVVDRERLRRQFSAVSDWTAAVPLLRLTYDWIHDEVERIRDAIIDTMRGERCT